MNITDSNDAHASLSKWNSYVFEQIFSSSDCIETQVRLARAFPQYLGDAIRAWRRDPFTAMLGPNTRMFEYFLDSNDYAFFMRSMAPHFKEFHMNLKGNGKFPSLFSYIQHLHKVGVTNLPAVKECCLIGNPNVVNDEDIYDLSKLMPNLKVFRLVMSVSGEFIERFQLLEELHLYSDFFALPLQSSIMESIVTKMHTLRLLDIRGPYESCIELHHINLPNLEDLKLNITTLLPITSEVLELPRLRKLTVNYTFSRAYGAPESAFEDILQAKAASVTGISVNNLGLQLEENWEATLDDVSLPKLRNLVYENWPHSSPLLRRTDYPKRQIESFGCGLWHTLTAPQLLRIISEYTGLKKLCINRCFFDKSILYDIENMLAHEARQQLEYQLPSRPRLFVYNFCNIMRDLSKRERQYWSANKYLDLEMKDYSEFRFQEIGFELEFE